jgi:hypothetical protein
MHLTPQHREEDHSIHNSREPLVIQSECEIGYDVESSGLSIFISDEHPQLTTPGPRGELWTFHAYDALVRGELHAAALVRERVRDGALEPLYEPTTERIAKSGVRDDGGVFEVARGAHALRVVDDLRRQCERAWRHILAQGADGAESEEGAYA